MSIKISVIIPVYNTEKYLKECLETVINQTLRDIEIICIDDGSTDKSLDILEEYKQKDSRFVVLRQENKGSGPARNNGIENAKGEYVIFIDADDFYPEDGTLEKLFNAATENDVIVCGGSWSNYDTNTGIINTVFNENLFGYTFNKNVIRQYSEYQFDYGYHRFIYNRNFLINNNLFFPDYRRFQDPPFFVKTMIAAKKFFVIKDVVYRYRNNYKKITWTQKMALHAMEGINDNLKIAKEYNYITLYNLSISRILDFFPHFNNVINPDIIKKLLDIYEDTDKYGIDEDLKDEFHKMIIYYFNDKIKIMEKNSKIIKIENDKAIKELKSSFSFRLGHFLTWLPRKIRDRKNKEDNPKENKIKNKVYNINDFKENYKKIYGKCPICGNNTFEPGYLGRLAPNNMFPQCCNCKSVERHRIIRTIYMHIIPLLKNLRVLQFAPDKSINQKWFKEYHYSSYKKNNSLDITAINLPDNSYDLVLSNHVIEHVSDDYAAIRECLRVVGQNGIVHINAPSSTFRYKTLDWGFPDPNKIEHYRSYGADIGQRLIKNMPDVHCIGITGIDPVTFTFDTIFLFSKSENKLIEFTKPLFKGIHGCVVIN